MSEERIFAPTKVSRMSWVRAPARTFTHQCPSWSKEPDLRSGARKSAWVQTPPDAFSSYIFIHIYDENWY